ncbi:unnamed protein product [Arctia plantaginis]|uniref:Uncharacterized protein n=1 Tax=Arctia plantaginis TaxID=874455 RepID=A0A8S1ALE0_ARCPL|nr:unnamed protein product [Arctia plantaginis]
MGKRFAISFGSDGGSVSRTKTLYHDDSESVVVSEQNISLTSKTSNNTEDHKPTLIMSSVHGTSRSKAFYTLALCPTDVYSHALKPSLMNADVSVT